MNKQEAIKCLDAIEAEQKELRKIIEAPEKRTGRVMPDDDLSDVELVYVVSTDGEYLTVYSSSSKNYVAQGNAFYDEESARKEVRYRALMQELRQAQRDDGGIPKVGEMTHFFEISSNMLINDYISFQFKTTGFRNKEALKKFMAAHTEEDLCLICMGVQ